MIPSVLTVAEEEQFYFVNNITCNNVTVAVTCPGTLAFVEVSRTCSCTSRTNTWSDTSYSSNYYSVPLQCIDTGNFFVRVKRKSEAMSSGEIVNFNIIVAKGNQEGMNLSPW